MAKKKVFLVDFAKNGTNLLFISPIVWVLWRGVSIHFLSHVTDARNSSPKLTLLGYLTFDLIKP